MLLLCPSWLSWRTLHFLCHFSENLCFCTTLLSITLIYPSVFDSMSLLERVSQYSASLEVKGWISPSCFNLSITCPKVGVADYITSEHVLKRTAMLDIYFSLAWEIQLIPFNQSITGCSKFRGIGDIAVMNCLLFSEHVISCSRTGSDGKTISFSEEESYPLGNHMSAQEQDSLWFPLGMFLLLLPPYSVTSQMSFRCLM